MIRITLEQVLKMHEQLLSDTGGSNGVRDIGLLSAALDAPFQTFDNQDLFPSIQEKAARLGFGLIENHPMVDGNKRIGIHAMLVFLSINGIELEYTQQELYTITLDIASGKRTYQDLLEWLTTHQRKLNI